MPLRRWLIAALAALALAAQLVPGRVHAAPDSPGAPAEARRALVLTRVEFAGLSRTKPERAERATGLALPTEATPERIAEALANLRASRLFESVEAHARADSSGGVTLVVSVREARPALRFGVGHEDFSSWYLIPAQLAFDNLDGRGLGASASVRLGYRVTGFEALLRRPSARDARDFWELRLAADALDRVYFLDSTETKHRVERGGFGVRAGRALSSAWALEGWAAIENVKVDSTATVYADRANASRGRGDVIPFDELPLEIQRDVRDRPQSRVGLALLYDRRAGHGLETRGVWARFSGEGAFSDVGDFASWQADVRAYAPLARDVQLALRVRGAALSHQAPFHERYYAGGLYTVRGYPSQSLSPPGGDLNLGCASLEVRTPWLGTARSPQLAALAFVDAGASWSREAPRLTEIASGAGFGFRLRMPWLGYLGLDVARPLSRSQVEEAFHLNGVIGWTF